MYRDSVIVRRYTPYDKRNSTSPGDRHRGQCVQRNGYGSVLETAERRIPEPEDANQESPLSPDLSPRQQTEEGSGHGDRRRHHRYQGYIKQDGTGGILDHAAAILVEEETEKNKPLLLSSYGSSSHASPTPKERMDRLQARHDACNVDSRIHAKHMGQATENLRLINESSFPLNHSGSKYVTVGVDPFTGYTPLIQVMQLNSTKVVCFDIADYEHFLLAVGRLLDNLENSEENHHQGSDVLMDQLRNYNVYLTYRGTIKFSYVHGGDNHISDMCMMKETLKMFTHIGNHILEIARQLNTKQYPDYGYFVTDLACAFTESCSEPDKIIFDVIKSKYENNNDLIELYCKFMRTIKEEIIVKSDYLNEYNRYP